MTHFGVVGALLDVFGFILTHWWIWIPVASGLGFLAWQNIRKSRWLLQIDQQVLAVSLNDDPTAESIDKLAGVLTSLSEKLRRDKAQLVKEGAVQEHLGFEQHTTNDGVRWYVWIPSYYRQYFSRVVLSAFPNARIEIVPEDEDPVRAAPYAEQAVVVSGIEQDYHSAWPLTSPHQASHMFRLLQELPESLESHEALTLQVLAQPTHNWRSELEKAALGVKQYGGVPVRRIDKVLCRLPAAIRQQLTTILKLEHPPRVSTDTSLELFARQHQQGGFRVQLRIAVTGMDLERAQSVVWPLFNTINEESLANNLILKGFSGHREAVHEFGARYLSPGTKNYISSADVAGLWQPFSATPSTVENHTSAVVQEAPPVASDEDDPITEHAASIFASTPDGKQITLRRRDRKWPVVLTGEEGAGKTSLLTLLALNDLAHYQGVIAIDNHGQFTKSLISHIPEPRIAQSVVFDINNPDYSLAINPLLLTESHQANPFILTDDIVALFGTYNGQGQGSLSDAAEHLLTQSVRALAFAAQATLSDITLLLKEHEFRTLILPTISDPATARYWQETYPAYSSETKAELIDEIEQYTSGLLNDMTLRTIVNQPTNSLDFAQFYENQGILLVNTASFYPHAQHLSQTLSQLLLIMVRHSVRPDSDHRDNTYVYIDHPPLNPQTQTLYDSFLKHGMPLGMTLSSYSDLPPAWRDRVHHLVFREPNASHYTSRLPDMISRAESLEDRSFIYRAIVDDLLQQPFAANSLTIPAGENLDRFVLDHSKRHFLTSTELLEQSRLQLHQAKHHIVGQNKKRTLAETAQEKQNYSRMSAIASSAPAAGANQQQVKTASQAGNQSADTQSSRQTLINATQHIAGELKHGDVIKLR